MEKKREESRREGLVSQKPTYIVYTRYTTFVRFLTSVRLRIIERFCNCVKRTSSIHSQSTVRPPAGRVDIANGFSTTSSEYSNAYSRFSIFPLLPMLRLRVSAYFIYLVFLIVFYIYFLTKLSVAVFINFAKREIVSELKY